MSNVKRQLIYRQSIVLQLFCYTVECQLYELVWEKGCPPVWKV